MTCDGQKWYGGSVLYHALYHQTGLHQDGTALAVRHTSNKGSAFQWRRLRHRGYSQRRVRPRNSEKSPILETKGIFSKLVTMATFSVNPEKAKQLAQRMVALGVRETHIEETFVRSGGHGGQNVNKSATCVMLLHRPTGFQVKCQTTRQQGLNRFIAWRLLLDKIENAQTEKAADERSRIEKARRQKRKKSHGAKVRMLADKSRRADKKASRRRIGDFDS